jgi:SOS-response transcriptional repressor LexA
VLYGNDSLRIFVASPGDVIRERDLLFCVIEGLITHVARNLGLIIEVVRWEDLRPGIGVDGQAVVNAQVGPFDLFIGIFWNRFGTPTSRAESGTREEFDLAFRRWQKKKDVEIWTYFSQQPYNFTTHEELEQKAKVLDFKQELATTKGVLFRTYESPSDFENQVRGHLLSLITERLRREQIPILGTTSAGNPMFVPDQTTFPLGWIGVRPGALPRIESPFALWIAGDSMIEAGINDGDLVIFRRQNWANDGEIIATFFKDDHTTTLKRFGRSRSRICLHPANSTRRPINVKPTNLEVQGKAIAVVPQKCINNGFAEKIAIL